MGDVMDDVDDLGLRTAESSCYPTGNPYNCRPPAPAGEAPRVVNPATGTIDWPIAPGTAMYDGLGNPRGVVTDPSVKINYGIRKLLRGNTLVYAWAASLDTGSASGWVPEAALVHANLLQGKMPTLVLPNPGGGEYATRWIVTGGDPARYGELKVTKNYDEGGRKATDYLLRPGNVVNIVYNVPGRGLGGFSVDTVPAGVIFRRARGVSQLQAPLYQPDGSSAVDALHFVYGYIEDGDQRRYGWMAKEALVNGGTTDPTGTPDPGAEEPSGGDGGGGDPGGGGEPLPPPPTPTGGECAVRCCDDTLAVFGTANADECRNAYGVCATHDHVLRMRFNGELIYERTDACYSYCCALCVNREAYHRVVGVTSGCTAAAEAYCAEGTRGGLEDAAWMYCDL